MKRTLTAVHDAPVVRSPRPGSPPRVEIARVSTPAAFPWLDACLFERSERLPVNGWCGTHIRPWSLDGVAWHPVFHVGTDGRPTARAVHPDELVEWLSGEADPDASHAIPLARAFAGSPLAPRPLRPLFGKAARGVTPMPAFDPRDAAGVAADDREACAAEVRRIVSDEIVAAEGTVLVRFRPKLRYFVEGKKAREGLVLTPEASVAEPVLRLSRRYDANVMMRMRVEFSDGLSRLFREGLATLPGSETDDDMRIMANLLPGAIRLGMERAAAGLLDLPPNRTVEAVRAADAEMASLERRGAFGLIGPEEVPAALEAMRAAARQVSMVAERGLPVNRYMAFYRAHEYVARVLSERIPDHAASDDADALGALVP